jgi:hypothetical protein
MPAFMLLQRIQGGNPDLEDGKHGTECLVDHCKKEGRFIAFMALTLVAILLLQDSLSTLIRQLMCYMFPESKIKRAIYMLVCAILLAPIIILLGLI